MTEHSAADIIAYLKSLGLDESTIAKFERLARDKGISLEALLTNNFLAGGPPRAQKKKIPSRARPSPQISNTSQPQPQSLANLHESSR